MILVLVSRLKSSVDASPPLLLPPAITAVLPTTAQPWERRADCRLGQVEAGSHWLDTVEYSRTSLRALPEEEYPPVTDRGCSNQEFSE